MYSIQPATGDITLPRGDTLLFTIRMNREFPDGTAAVFGICGARRGLPTTNVFTKTFPVNGSEIIVLLANRDTRGIAAGSYLWDVRIVTDPEYDDGGSVKCDDETDNVTSIYSGGVMPTFTLTEVAANV